MLRVVLVCKLNDNTVNERFKYQCSKDVKNTTFRAYTRYQVKNEYTSNEYTFEYNEYELDKEYTLETSCF